MSRYVILTKEETLEVIVGFDEGFGGLFLTIADTRNSTGEEGEFLFHNLDHHPGVRMTLEQLVENLARFGIKLPPELGLELLKDMRKAAVENGDLLNTQTPQSKLSHGREAPTRPEVPQAWAVDWKKL